MAANLTRFLVAIALLCVFGCFSRPSLMTYSEFDQIKIGTDVMDLKAEVGKPYAIHAKEGGTDEYEYIERVNSGNNLIAENHYFLIIKDGKVIGKYMSREGPPPYDLIYLKEPNYQGFP